jgi:hypothetical protein
MKKIDQLNQGQTIRSIRIAEMECVVLKTLQISEFPVASDD